MYALNPMAGVIQGFRWALLGSKPPGPDLWISVAVVVVLLVSWIVLFPAYGAHVCGYGMSDLAIRVENLGKQYRIGTLQNQRYQTLRDALALGLSAQPDAAHRAHLGA